MDEEANRRVAAIDLGSVRVGVAVSDELGLLAHPRPALSGKDPKALLKQLVVLAQSETVGRFLVGLPRSLSGVEGPPARRARAFAVRLGTATGVPVELVDERLSTVEAQARLSEQGLTVKKSRGRIDSAAAAVLLQAWLNHNGDTSGA